MPSDTVREATHAGSWYTRSKSQLSQQLDGWLNAVPSSTSPIGTASSQTGSVAIPTPSARAIIAPHAGYSYSGPAAAWAYKSVDWSQAKRVFLLGPSHHHYLSGAETTQFEKYETPLGDLEIDRETVDKISKEWGLKYMDPDVDEAEHSLEMHLPYIYKMLSKTFPSTSLPPLIPILIGNTSASTERTLGAALAPYLRDPTNIFVISSDFCHWGRRFQYTYTHRNWSSNQAIHESIAHVDKQSMDAVESGSHSEFLGQLRETGNTVCGRHPIGVFMAAVESLSKEGDAVADGTGRFRFLRYERSSLVEEWNDSSVSYCSAFAVL